MSRGRLPALAGALYRGLLEQQAPRGAASALRGALLVELAGPGGALAGAAGRGGLALAVGARPLWPAAALQHHARLFHTGSAAWQEAQPAAAKEQQPPGGETKPPPPSLPDAGEESHACATALCTPELRQR